MSGHSKWSTIKHKKALTDAKKGKVFSKTAHMITLAARKGENPDMNPDLRLAIEKAKEVNMPKDNIEKAIKRGSGVEQKKLEEFLYEAYGPEGVAILIEGITDNKNRTSQEIKHLLGQNNSKMADPGSVLWMFDKKEKDWIPKYNIGFKEEKSKKSFEDLLEALSEQDDIQEIYSNVEL